MNAAAGAAPSSARLYTPEILALAVSLAALPDPSSFPLIGEARSRTCGSTVHIGLRLDESGRISEVGMRVAACSIGQAASAIFAEGAVGKSLDGIGASRLAISEWLEKSGPLPDWPGFTALTHARGYPARHGAILLAWNAALSTRETHR